MEVLNTESLHILAIMITAFWVSAIALAVGFAIDGAKAEKERKN